MDNNTNILTCNALADICAITTIPTASMQKLFNKISYCIANSVYEAFLGKKNSAEIDIGFGHIIVNIEQNQLLYKFIPSPKLEKNIIDSIRQNKNPLDIKLEDTFINRILKTYKDMM